VNTPLYEHLPFGPFESVDHFLDTFVEERIRSNPACILFAVFDKTKASPGNADGELAGTIGLLNTSTANLVTEIGFVLMLPAFRRTHVTSNAIGLLLRYALNLPTAGGLGLRRVVWQASAINGPSLRAAERMGFKREGVLRWTWVLPEGKERGNGRERRKGDPKENQLGRDTVVLGLCWDDWENGGEEQVDAIIARTS
jgi:RimJ/RimL family protein N-acetyltransferase